MFFKSFAAWKSLCVVSFIIYSQLKIYFLIIKQNVVKQDLTCN
nr:MAG TPA: hypothetical protein [Caudoviricetes sp.]